MIEDSEIFKNSTGGWCMHLFKSLNYKIHVLALTKLKPEQLHKIEGKYISQLSITVAKYLK